MEKLFSYSNTTCEGMQSAGRIFGAGRAPEYTCRICKTDMDQAVKIYYNRVRKEGKRSYQNKTSWADDRFLPDGRVPFAIWRQDAYTYLFRGKVFANAQTGNIVLLSSNIMDGQWDRVLHYLVPLCAFALGVLVAEKMRESFCNMQRLHWRQLVVLGEVLLLFIVGFLPQEQNLLANAIVSFSCAMQVQAFRKVNGYAFASTMCIGDLRSGVEAFCIWSKTHEPKVKDRMMRYFGIILLFAVGAGIGSMGAARLAGKTIWISCGLLLVSFALMFIREEIEENPAIEKDLAEIRQETREIDRTLKQELKEEREELHEELHEKLR